MVKTGEKSNHVRFFVAAQQARFLSKKQKRPREALANAPVEAKTAGKSANATGKIRILYIRKESESEYGSHQGGANSANCQEHNTAIRRATNTALGNY